METGNTDFTQVKVVVDESIVKMPPPLDENGEPIIEETEKDPDDLRTRLNTEHHILLEDAKKIKRGAEIEDEIVFPLETKEDFGRIAAQTAKQVIIQKIREAEKSTTMEEFGHKEGGIVSGIVQRVEKGNVFVDLGKSTAILPYEEQISREHFRPGERIKAFLYRVEDTPRGINLRLSRTHPKLIEEFFKMETPEVATGVVEIKNIAREPGSRSKIAVYSHDEHIDPVGSCVGQRGVRVNTVMSELGGEKIDIIEWSDDAKRFIVEALAPAKIMEVRLREEEKRASVTVMEDQLSLAIGKGGQNARLAAKLTGWKIDIHPATESDMSGPASAEGYGAAMKDGTDEDEETKAEETVAEESHSAEGSDGTKKPKEKKKRVSKKKEKVEDAAEEAEEEKVEEKEEVSTEE
jgi:N utilization substance protein A